MAPSVTTQLPPYHDAVGAVGAAHDPAPPGASPWPEEAQLIELEQRQIRHSCRPLFRRAQGGRHRWPSPLVAQA